MHLSVVTLLVVVELECALVSVRRALLYFVIHGEHVSRVVGKCCVSDLHVKHFRRRLLGPVEYSHPVLVTC